MCKKSKCEGICNEQGDGEVELYPDFLEQK